MGQCARMGTKSGRGRAPIYCRRRGAQQRKTWVKNVRRNHSVSEQWTSVTYQLAMKQRLMTPSFHHIRRFWSTAVTSRSEQSMRVELVIQPPVFSQSGILSYLPYELDHPRPIDRPNSIVSVLHAQRRVIQDLLPWIHRDGYTEMITSMVRQRRKSGTGPTSAKSLKQDGAFGR